jgi:hypothetical protein
MPEWPFRMRRNLIQRNLHRLFNCGGLVRGHGDGLQQIEAVLVVSQLARESLTLRPNVWIRGRLRFNRPLK